MASKRTKTRYGRLKAKHICICCGREKAHAGKVTCQKCSELLAEKQKSRYAWLKSHHICVRCSRENALKDRVLCSSCRKKQHSGNAPTEKGA